MNPNELLREFKPLSDERFNVAQKIKSHNLPVILYGAAGYSSIITKSLKSFNVPISGYAVDEEYYNPGRIFLGLPVFNFNKLSLKPDKYVFVLAFEGQNNEAEQKFLNRKDLLMYKFHYEWKKRFTPIDYKFVEDNVDKFVETYNWLEDDLSRESFIHYIKLKITGDLHFNDDVYVKEEYYNDLTADFNLRGGGIC